MLENFVKTLKTRFTSRVGDESHFQATGDRKSRNVFLKLLNASYALVSQQQDDAYCNENQFMLPRVYSQNTEQVSGLWSPISLKQSEKPLDELDNVVEKFIRCINVENRNFNVKQEFNK